ncbi:MAG: SMI1/KNR4 family protein [Sphingomonas sp.]
MFPLPATFQPSGTADSFVFSTGMAALGHILPDDYIKFMEQFNGGEGFIGEHYLSLWKSGDLKTHNREYEFPKYAPALFAFGSNGGGEAFAFDMRVTPATVVIVPFIGLSYQDATWVAASFDDFLARLQHNPASFWET